MKYILYHTVNTVNHKCYLGIHKTENPYDFDGYLGNGVKISDRHTYKFSKTPFEYAVNKYGVDKFIRTTLRVFDTLEEALKFEKLMVDDEFISRKNTYNIALGGNVPPAQKKSIYQYDLNGVFIKEWDSITEAAVFYKCSNSAIGKAIFDRTKIKGYLWTENKYDKLDLNVFFLKKKSKISVYLYDESGKYLTDFESIADCALYVGCDESTISKAIRTKGFVNKMYYVSDFRLDFFEKCNKDIHKNLPLYQYDLDGIFIRKWDSYSDVKKYFGKENIAIHSSIKLGQSCMGSQWSWEYLPNMKKLSLNSKARRIGKFDLDDNLITIFDTVTEARKDTSASYLAAQGKRKTAGGYIWKYLD